MQKLSNLLLVAGAILGLGVQRVVAQPPPGMAGMDPQQFQQQMRQRMMDYFRQQLVVTNDEEWAIIQGRLSKVAQAKMDVFMGSLGGLRGMMGRNRGEGGGGGPRGFFGMDQPDPDLDALQRALDAKASKDQIKAAMAKLREARQRKAAELTKVQDQLREVLTFRQEAILVSLGMLD